jgi:hypothetical protein
MLANDFFVAAFLRITTISNWAKNGGKRENCILGKLI